MPPARDGLPTPRDAHDCRPEGHVGGASAWVDGTGRPLRISRRARPALRPAPALRRRPSCEIRTSRATALLWTSTARSQHPAAGSARASAAAAAAACRGGIAEAGSWRGRLSAARYQSSARASGSSGSSPAMVPSARSSRNAAAKASPGARGRPARARSDGSSTRPDRDAARGVAERRSGPLRPGRRAQGQEHDGEPRDMPATSRTICLASCHLVAPHTIPSLAFLASKARSHHTTTAFLHPGRSHGAGAGPPYSLDKRRNDSLGGGGRHRRDERVLPRFSGER